MVDQSVSGQLAGYRIGEKLRRLRLRRSMGLVELGRHTGLSPALLSKIERGRMFPTLPTLTRIATVFSVGLEALFTDDRPVVAVVRRGERQSFPERLGGRAVAFHFESLDFKANARRMNSYLATFADADGQASAGHEHPGAEFIYVLRGRLAVDIAGERHVLEARDSMYFDSSSRHSYHRLGSRACEAIVVTAP
jgi:transcriptional regulator with XRE-family HTH domain